MATERGIDHLIHVGLEQRVLADALRRVAPRLAGTTFTMNRNHPHRPDRPYRTSRNIRKQQAFQGFSTLVRFRVAIPCDYPRWIS